MSQANLTGRFAMTLTVLLLARPVGAEEAPSPPQPHVVLVGISKYADTRIKSRAHAEADAQALYDLFTSKDYLGADPRNVKLLLGSRDVKRGSQPASRENILQALRWVVANARAHDPVFFVFIGNGGQLGVLGDRRCYFACDSTFKDRSNNAVAAADVGEVLKDLKARHFAAFLDVDFKGFDAPARVSDPFPAVSLDRLFLDEDRRVLPVGEDESPFLPGRAVFLATDGVSVPVDGETHGLFTTVLLKGLKGAADRAGDEPDGLVTVPELADYLTRQRPRLNKEEGNKGPTPRNFFVGDPSAGSVLTRNPEARPTVEGRLKRLDTLINSGKLPRRYVAEAKAFLERMPPGQIQRSLRKEYQTLVDGKIDLKTFEDRHAAILERTRLPEHECIRFAKQVEEAVQLVQESYIKKQNTGELIAWGIKGLYQHLDERIPEEIETKLRKVRTMTEEELRELLVQARRRLGKREDLDKHKGLAITLQHMLRRLDPYTTYIDPEHVEKFRGGGGEGHPVGIGLQVHKEHLSGMLLGVVQSRNSPAYKMGLRTGDLITRITAFTDADGQPVPPEESFASQLSTAEAVKKILGKSNAQIQLTIQRPGEPKTREFVVTRRIVVAETVLGHQRDAVDDWDYLLDRENKIAYVRLTQFWRNTLRDLTGVMQVLKGQGIRGLVLDLRFNPGGLLDSAVKTADLFVGDGLIITVRPRASGALPPLRFHGQKEGSHQDFPMVCLVNDSTVWASEVVAAALQDHHRAWIIGERTHGKASVQNIQAFEGGEIKMTTALFLGPSGRNLDRFMAGGKEADEWGIIPDKEIRLSRKERHDLADALANRELIWPAKMQPATEFKDRQLAEVLVYLRQQVKLGASISPARLARKEKEFDILRP